MDGEELRARCRELKHRQPYPLRAIIVCTPANPTGTLLAPAEMAGIAELGPLVISDEVYHGLVYEGRAHSILECTDQALVLNGFSKLFAMTGWRLGYVIAPPSLVRPMQKLQQNLFISAGAFVQRAGIAALQQAWPDVQRMVERYNQRRRVILAGLRDIGWLLAVPACLSAIQFLLLAADKPPEYARFAMLPFRATPTGSW